MDDATVFVAIPLHDSRMHHACVGGMMQLQSEMPGRARFDVQVGSFLPRNRDILTSRFLDSGATHMLCVDSDIGWTAADALALLETGRDFVSGVYCKKQPDRGIPARYDTETTDQLRRAEFVPGGFLLLSRPCVERMVGSYRHLQYKTNFGYIWALWSSLFEAGKSYDGEDVSFCRRWTAIGGDIWLHTGVVVRHYGEAEYKPHDPDPATWPSS